MTQPRLDASLIQHLMDVVISCLRSTVGVEAVAAAVRAPPSDGTAIAVALDFHGDLRGPVTWRFPPELALELVRRLMADPNPPPEAINDGATELANILTGYATAVLEMHGFSCEFGPPRVHRGALPPGIAVHISTPNGLIDVVLPPAAQ